MALAYDTPLTQVLSSKSEAPVAAAETIFEGAMLGDADGYAEALVAGDKFIGHSLEHIDNSLGAAGARTVEHLTGRYKLKVTISGVAITDRFKTVYATDDGTYTLTGGANSRVGVVVRYIATNTALVEFQPVEAQLLTNSGTAALSGPSPLIWSGAPLLDVMLDPTKGFLYFTDFLEFGGLSLAANGSDHGLTLVERADGTLANNPAIPGGVMVLSSVNNTADQGGTLQILGCQCEPKTGTTIRMEWRCMVSEDGGQCFMGLCDDAMAAPVTSSDAIVANNLAGFYRDAGTGDADWTAGCADGASNDEDDDIATSVKTTYHKYGIVISGIGAVTGSTIKFYFDGVLVYTTTDIADIPLLLMCPCFQMDGDGTDVVTMSMDWLRVLVSHETGLCREATA